MMINIYLLSKIAGNDMEFRRRIMLMISSKAGKFRLNFERMAAAKNWNSCYYLALDFFNQVVPYCSVPFLNDLQKTLDILSDSNDPHLKEVICRALIQKIQMQKVEADKRISYESEAA